MEATSYYPADNVAVDWALRKIIIEKIFQL
jgi:hypothetical protein